MLLAWKENYSENQAFYYFIALTVTYAALSLGYIYFEKYHYIHKQKLGELKTEATKMNLPYRDEYIFNNDLQMEQEIKCKLKDKILNFAHKARSRMEESQGLRPDWKGSG